MERSLVPVVSELIPIFLKERSQMWMQGLDLKLNHHGSTKEDGTRECSHCRTPGFCTLWLIGQTLNLTSRLTAQQAREIVINEQTHQSPETD